MQGYEKVLAHSSTAQVNSPRRKEEDIVQNSVIRDNKEPLLCTGKPSKIDSFIHFGVNLQRFHNALIQPLIPCGFYLLTHWISG